jgi:sulfite exporter TauE/SafE
MGHGVSIARIVAGFLLVAMGLYLAGWWYGLNKLEKLGGVVWQRIQPLGQKIVPVDSVYKALLLGALWGWLPCGLVYSALAFSLAQDSAVESALTMLAFGLGTLPALLSSGWFASQLRQIIHRKGLRQFAGVLVVGFGVWTLLAAGGVIGSHSMH